MDTAKQQRSGKRADQPDRWVSQRRYLGMVLAAYWVTLFIATHIPLSALPGDTPSADKLAHLLGYGGLGLLLGLWAALRTSLSVPVLLLLWGLLAAYGAADEWLQQFVNRTTDFNDWVADVIGATIGIGIVWLLQHLRPLDDKDVVE